MGHRGEHLESGPVDLGVHCHRDLLDPGAHDVELVDGEHRPRIGDDLRSQRTEPLIVAEVDVVALQPAHRDRLGRSLLQRDDPQPQPHDPVICHVHRHIRDDMNLPAAAKPTRMSSVDKRGLAPACGTTESYLEFLNERRVLMARLIRSYYEDL